HCEGEKKNPRVLRSAGRAQGNSLDPSSVSGSLGLLPPKSSPNPPPSESRLTPSVGTSIADRVVIWLEAPLFGKLVGLKAAAGTSPCPFQPDCWPAGLLR